MELRALGASGLSVPPLILGAMDMRANQSSDAERLATLSAAVDAGLVAIDTAPLYEFGRSERLVGQVARAHPGRVLLLSKVGLSWDGEHGEVLFPFRDEQGRPRFVRKDSRPATVRREVEGSLRRLRVDHLDLVQVHHPDRLVPIAETMGALRELHTAGKVRAVGVCNYEPGQVEEARRALHPVPLASVQLPYSLLKREVEAAALPQARALGCGFLAYSPLELGLLGGKLSPERRFPPEDMRSFRASFRPENRARVNEVLERAVAPVARAHQATVAQVVLAWTIGEPGVTAAIAGVSRAEQARENVRAAELILEAGERAAIRAAFAALTLDLREVWQRASLLSRLARKLRSLR